MAKQYRAVNGAAVSDSGDWAPFLKQLHMSSGVWILSFAHGLATGAPTVFVPQIRREWNSTVTIDDELASWFYSMSNFSAVPWIFVLPILSHYIGRKIPYLLCSTAITIVFTVLYFSSAPYHILIALGIEGYVAANTITITIYIIPEYSSHRYRNMYLNIQVTTFYWGMWASNAIGTFTHWKYIAVFGLICSFYLFTVCLYPESPRWLASKRKINQCEEAHRWLYGCSLEAEKELRDLINSQADHPVENYKITCSGLLKTLTCKPFYMPLLIVILVGAQYNFSGKFVCSIYAIDFLKRITKGEDTAYTGMLILDGVTVLGMYIGSVLPKFLKVRPLFLKLSLLSIITMCALSLYIYLVNLKIIEQNDILTLGFLVVYSLAVSSGPIILCISIYSEIISIRYQAISYMIASFIFLCSATGILKFTPIFLKALGIHGTFLFFGISSGIATVLIYLYLPETKNKTLLEIEECFKDTERLPEAETLTMPVEDSNRNRKLSI